jgi:hypothetical protein
MKKPHTSALFSGLLLMYVLFSSLSATPPIAPPECVGQLNAVLLPLDTDGDGTPDVGAATITATDLVVNPLPHPVQYSLRIHGQLPNIERNGILLNCDFFNPFDFNGTPVGFKVDVWENGALVDSCSTTVYVQDQVGICAQCNCGGSVNGKIQTITGNPVSNYEISVLELPEISVDINPSGSYVVSNVPLGSNITIVPSSNANYLNGVSILDVVLIQRHLLSVQLLDSPYKRIAADVNESGKISLMDVIILRRLLLHALDEFPNGKSWRFIPASYSFPVPTNPWFEQFPEVININDISGTLIHQNFTAIKLGDVNGSAGGG